MTIKIRRGLKTAYEIFSSSGNTTLAQFLIAFLTISTAVGGARLQWIETSAAPAQSAPGHFSEKPQFYRGVPSHQ